MMHIDCSQITTSQHSAPERFGLYVRSKGVVNLNHHAADLKELRFFVSRLRDVSVSKLHIQPSWKRTCKSRLTWILRHLDRVFLLPGPIHSLEHSVANIGSIRPRQPSKCPLRLKHGVFIQSDAKAPLSRPSTKKSLKITSLAIRTSRLPTLWFSTEHSILRRPDQWIRNSM